MSWATVLAKGNQRRPRRCADHLHSDVAFSDKAAHPWSKGPDEQTPTHLKTRCTRLDSDQIICVVGNQVASVRHRILYLSSQNSHVPESLIKDPFSLQILLQI